MHNSTVAHKEFRLAYVNLHYWLLRPIAGRLDLSKPTCSVFPFLTAFFPLFPPSLGVAWWELCGSLACLLPRDGETDVIIVGWTIHWKSGVEEIAVTVGTNGVSWTLISWQSSCKKEIIDSEDYNIDFLFFYFIYFHAFSGFKLLWWQSSKKPTNHMFRF